MNREKALKIVLALVGLLFLALVYPMLVFGRQEPALSMQFSLYVTLGIFLLLAIPNPSSNRSLIAFTAWLPVRAPLRPEPLDSESSVGHSCVCPFDPFLGNCLLVTISFSGQHRMDNNLLKLHRCPRQPIVRCFGLLFCLLTFSAFSLCGGCSRNVSQEDLVGTYQLKATWGCSELLLYLDHTFQQQVERGCSGKATSTINGTWSTEFHGRSVGRVEFRPFINVTDRSDLSQHQYDYLPVKTSLWGGILLEADSDAGVSYRRVR